MLHTIMPSTTSHTLNYITLEYSVSVCLTLLYQPTGVCACVSVVMSHYVTAHGVTVLECRVTMAAPLHTADTLKSIPLHYTAVNTVNTLQHIAGAALSSSDICTVANDLPISLLFGPFVETLIFKAKLLIKLL